MLNTLNEATGLQLDYLRESFLPFLPLNTVQYLLKDAENNLYFLVMSFDPMQDFRLKREAERQDEHAGLIWSGPVMGKQCSLYRYAPADRKIFRKTLIRQTVAERVPVDSQVIKSIETDFLAAYPENYHSKISSLPEYKTCFSALSKMEQIDIAIENGFVTKDNIGVREGIPTVLFCNFYKRFYQPVGFDEFMWKKLFRNSKQTVRNRNFNKNKWKLIRKINDLLFKGRAPSITAEEWTTASDYTEAFSLNHFPEIYPQSKNLLLTIRTQDTTDFLPVSLQENRAILGTWMNPIGRETLLASIRWIFQTQKDVKKIVYRNVWYDTLLDHGWKHNDFYLPLPDTREALKSRLSGKGRYNLQRERRIIQDELGGLDLKDIPFSEVSAEVIDQFYRFKSATHGVEQTAYDITQCHLTNVYVLTVGNDAPKGIALSCEQGGIVFLENHTFDSTMRRYSFGQVLYDMYLDRMIEKGKTGVALAGGNLEYKKRYGTWCAIARSGEIFRFAYRWARFAQTIGVGFHSETFRKIANKIQHFANRKEQNGKSI